MMRYSFLALLGTTILAGAALAQQQPQVTPNLVPQGTADAKAAIAECDRLAIYLEQARPADAGVTIEQVRAWQQASQAQPCRENLTRLTENASATSGSQAGASASENAALSQRVAPAAPAAAPPQASVQAPAAPWAGAAAPQVVVQQAQPNVTVRQQQPEILVRQAPPIITVQQPQPEIIVRMPAPDVNVAMTQPNVQVTLPQPQVQVIPPQAQVQPNVEVAGQQPNVRFERTGEPQIIYQPAEGQPQIRFEQAGAAPAASQPAQALPQQTAQAQLNADQRGYGTPSPQAASPGETGSLPSPGLQAVKASDLEDMSLYNARGEKMGEVEEVLLGADNKTYVLISHGGFLGLGQKQVALSSDMIAMRGDRLIAENLTDEQIRALPEFKESANFKEMDGNQTASLRIVQ